jgi:sulfite exporter TauE/SafE
MDFFGNLNYTANANSSYGMVFVLGLLTGAHCIGMCGGFMLTYLDHGKKQGQSQFTSHLKYATSKTISYTIFGGVFGAIGSVVYFSSSLKAGASMFGGFLLLYLGAKAFGLLPGIKKHFSSPKNLGRVKLSSPISIGLLNGLMIACGPLQAMYLIAAGLGDPFHGMALLFVFALGTLPLFLFYGVIIGRLKSIRSKWPDRLTAGIIVLFGIIMVNRGLSLGGYSLDFRNDSRAVHSSVKKQPAQLLKMTANEKGWGSDVLHFEHGRKIKWVIDVEKITACNNTIEIPALGISKQLELGGNIIEFDPGNKTTLVHTCWMGMMSGEFKSKQLIQTKK